MNGHKDRFRLVGLCGRAGAGKDTCAGILTASFGVATLAFADAVRMEIAASFGVDPRDLANPTAKQRKTPSLAIGRCDDGRFISLMASLGQRIDAQRSPREIMQLWGTEYRRALDGEEYWTHRAHDAIDALMRRGARQIVLTDVRFLNEAGFIRSLGGEIWRVRRALSDGPTASHRSESELETIVPQRTIPNDGELAELAAALQAAWMRPTTS